jgi:dipeptidyl aminopeptidase/acylaminoacyl peptidase
VAVTATCVAADAINGNSPSAPAAESRVEIVFSANKDGGWDFYRMDAGDLRMVSITKTRHAHELWGHCSAVNHKLVYVEKGSGIHVLGLENTALAMHLVKDDQMLFSRPACATDESILTLVKTEKTPEGMTTSGIIMANPKTFEITSIMKQEGRQTDPIWFHKSKTMLYVHAFVNPAKGSEFWSVSADGMEATLVCASEYADIHPDISSDDRQIAFASNRNGSYHIWLMSLEGSDLKQLTFGKGDDTEPKWSPDGRSILFLSDRTGRTHLYLVLVNGGDAKQLTQGLFDCAGPNWHVRPPKNSGDETTKGDTVVAPSSAVNVDNTQNATPGAGQN